MELSYCVPETTRSDQPTELHFVRTTLRFGSLDPSCIYRLKIYWLMQLITSQYEYSWDPTSILTEIHKYYGTVNTMHPYLPWQNTNFQLVCSKLQLHLTKNQKHNQNGTYYTPRCIIYLATDIHTNHKVVCEKHYNSKC